MLLAEEEVTARVVVEVASLLFRALSRCGLFCRGSCLRICGGIAIGVDGVAWKFADCERANGLEPDMYLPRCAGGIPARG